MAEAVREQYTGARARPQLANLGVMIAPERIIVLIGALCMVDARVGPPRR